MKIKKQQDQKDCGLFVLQAIYQHVNKRKISIDYLKSIAKFGPLGLNMKSLIDLGQEIGIELEAFEAPWSALQKEREKFIVLIKRNNLMHYVIFWIANQQVFLLDPAIGGKVKLSFSEFNKIYSGLVLTFNASFVKIIEKTNNFHSWTYLLANPLLLSWIIIVIVFSTILAFSSTLFAKIIFDQILPNFLTKTLTIVTISFILLAFWRVINQFLQNYFNKKFVNIIEIDLQKTYLNIFAKANLLDTNKITDLDHLRRLNLIPSNALFLATIIQIIFQESLWLIISVALLFWISSRLFIIIFALAIFNLIISIIFAFINKEQYQNLIFQQQDELQNKSEIIFSKKNLFYGPQQKYLLRKWDKSYQEFKENDWNIWLTKNIQGSINLLINYLSPILITFLGLKAIFAQTLSIGMLMMFLSMLNFFLSPISRLCDFAFRYKQNISNWNLLKFMFNLPITNKKDIGFRAAKIKFLSLNNFQVSLDKKIIDLPSLEIKESVYLKGPNGIGKSIFLQALAGIYQFKGKYEINKVPYQDWNDNDLRNKILLINDQEYLPTGSIYQYLTFNDAKLSQIWKENEINFELSAFLANNGLDLNSQIINNGHNFSSGQRQIILLLKIFARPFELLLLDEAFENMSIENFAWFKKQLSKSEKIFIEVSHSRKIIKARKELDFAQINQNF